MKKKTVKKVALKKTVLESYKASIKIFGKVHKAQGSTAAESIANLAPPGLSRGMSILSVTKGEKTVEKILNNFQTLRLFSKSGLTREIALKNTVGRFDL